MAGSLPSDIVSGFGLAAAMYLFVSPMVTMRRILKDKTSGHYSPLPYLAQLLESSLWTLYASLQIAELRSVFINNTIAIFFQSIYLAIFFVHPPAAKAQLSRLGTAVTLVSVLVAVAGVTVYAWSQGWSCDEGATSGVCQHVGTVAVVINILKYASPLSVMKRVIQTRSTKWMPLHLTIACSLCSLLWGAYGIIENDLPTIIANAGGCVACAAQLLLFCCYGSRCTRRRATEEQRDTNTMPSRSSASSSSTTPVNLAPVSTDEVKKDQDGRATANTPKNAGNSAEGGGELTLVVSPDDVGAAVQGPLFGEELTV